MTFSESAARALLLLLGFAAGADAQTVRVEGDARDPAAALIAEIVDRGDYLLIERDTVLGKEFVRAGDLVVAGATVRLAGRVAGAVAVIGGELFIRPGSEVGGPIAVAGGGVYPSAKAVTGVILEVAPEIAVETEHGERSHTLRLISPPPPRSFQMGGLFGIALPTYDRVDGLTLRAGGRLLLTREPGRPFVAGALAYRTGRNAPGGSVTLDAPLSRTLWLSAGAGRTTVTNERWIRGDLTNSLAALTLRSDARDYHESDALAVGLYRRPAEPLIEGESFIGPRLVLRASRDRSLPSADPWSLLGDGWRENPPIADGLLVSLLAGATGAWRGPMAAFDGEAAVEWAPGSPGDFEFAQLVADGRWSMRALWNHRIDVYGRTLLPFGSSGAPPQRWSFVGGGNTLPTFGYGAFRGDHLVFLRSIYSVPFPRVQLPVLGPPTLRLVQAAGTAWATGDPTPRWEQNLGAGLAFSLLRAEIYLNPADRPLAPSFDLSVSLPF